jgi:Xaa-Pro aminopeptidase
MIPTQHYAERRRQLLDRLEHPAILFAGGEVPRNSPFMPHPDRADSNFLVFFPPLEPDAAAFFDPGDGSVTLFLHERTEVDALWMGPRASFEEVRARLGVDAVVAVEKLEAEIAARLRGRPVQSVAVADARATERARRITGLDLDFFDAAKIAPASLRDALAALRMRKAAPEIDEMRRAAAITAEAFECALGATAPGVSEQELAAVLNGAFARRGAVPGYHTILSVRGEVLHNHGHEGVLRAGDLLLVDAGAEVESGWGADVTRAWPADGRFSAEQRAVYEIVLAGQKAALEKCRTGVRWRDVHITAARVIAEGLVEMGILRGSPDTLWEQGAVAVFFPHGVGHLLGLDTHDLRTFGDAVMLAPGRVRSTEPGLSFLRIDLDLSPGMVVTVEPGVYFVPGMIRSKERRAQLGNAVDFDRAERFLAMNGGRGFGGVRIEDDAVVTDDAPDVITGAVPKEIADVEALLGSARAVGH